MRQRVCIIVAGGSGRRMGGDIPKQFLLLDGRPVLMRTIERILAFDKQIRIILVLPQQERERWERLCDEYGFDHNITIADGGKERFYSVQNALKHIIQGEVVGIHDGVRPLVSDDTLRRCFDEAERSGNAVPCIGVTDSLRHIDTEGMSHSVPRNEYLSVQTPQVFTSEMLMKAYEATFSPEFTDDASVVGAAGYTINIVDGNRENIKITTPTDMAIAEVLTKM